MKRKTETVTKLIGGYSLNAILAIVVLLSSSSCEGPEGPIGPEGPAGPTGATGAAGANGTNGTNGQNFSNYIQPFTTGYTFAAPVSTTGSVSWFATTDDHFNSTLSFENNGKVESGDIEDSQSSTLAIAVNMPHSGLCQFEASIDSEKFFDDLSWYLDGVKINGISGFGGPFVFYFSVPSGEHIITFKYEKDISSSTVADAARLDNILITNYAVGGRVALPAQPVLPSTVSLWSERPVGLTK